MKKIICAIFLLLLAILLFTLSGCDDMYDPIYPENESNDRFVVVERDIEMDSSGVWLYTSCVYADKETGVQYLAISGEKKAGITVLLNSDGSPMIYDFEKNEVIKK